MTFPIPGSDHNAATESQNRADAVQALMSLNCDASLALVRRTRYAVLDTAIVLREQRVRRRRNIGLALMTVFATLILLAPLIWSGAEDFLTGEHLGDFSSQMALLLLMFAPAMLGALVAVWKEQLAMQHKRHDF